jgi:hypothetical protein
MGRSGYGEHRGECGGARSHDYEEDGDMLNERE